MNPMQKLQIMASLIDSLRGIGAPFNGAVYIIGLIIRIFIFYTAFIPNSTFFHADKIDSRNTHGTGCTLSSAIASHLARGENMHDAVEKGKQFLTNALAAGKDVAIGKGHGPLNHFFAPEKLIIK